MGTVGALGEEFRDLGGKRDARKVGTGEEIPDTLATRGRCCPIKGPGEGRDSGTFFLKLKWLLLPLGLHSSPQTHKALRSPFLVPWKLSQRTRGTPPCEPSGVSNYSLARLPWD